MKFAEEFKFRLRGFSSSRVAIILDALFFLYLIAIFQPLVQANFPGGSLARELLAPAGGLLQFALILCLLPPYNHTKFYLCWPLTGLAMLVLMLVMPL